MSVMCVFEKIDSVTILLFAQKMLRKNVRGINPNTSKIIYQSRCMPSPQLGLLVSGDATKLHKIPQYSPQLT